MILATYFIEEQKSTKKEQLHTKDVSHKERKADFKRTLLQWDMESTFEENELYIANRCKQILFLAVLGGADLYTECMFTYVHRQDILFACLCACVFVSVHAYICLCMCILSFARAHGLWFCLRLYCLYRFVCIRSVCMDAPQYETVAKTVRFKAPCNSIELWVPSVLVHCCHLRRIMIVVTMKCSEQNT